MFDVARHDGSFDWSISGLFEREIEQACPLATTSKVILQLPQMLEPYQYDFNPKPQQGTHFEGSEDNKIEIAVYDLIQSTKENGPFQLAMTWRDVKNRASKKRSRS